MHMSSIFGPVKTQLNGKRQMGHMWSLLSMKRKLAGQQSPGGKHHMRIQGRHGPKISKHGVEMHCKYCNEAGHNQRGCKLKKAGLRPNQQPKKSIQNPEVITTEVMPSFIQWFPSKIKTSIYHDFSVGAISISGANSVSCWISIPAVADTG